MTERFCITVDVDASATMGKTENQRVGTVKDLMHDAPLMDVAESISVQKVRVTEEVTAEIDKLTVIGCENIVGSLGLTFEQFVQRALDNERERYIDAHDPSLSLSDRES